MTKQIYYHGTKEENKKKIIESRKLKQTYKEYEQSEDGFVYICDEKDFAQTISYATDPLTMLFTFVKIEIIVDSELYKNLHYEEKKSCIGTLKSYKYNGEIDFNDEGINSAKIVTLDKINPKYIDFVNIITEESPNYDEAKKIIDGLKWEQIK